MFHNEYERRPLSVQSSNSRGTTASGVGHKNSKGGSSSSNEINDIHKHKGEDKSGSDFDTEENIYGRATSSRRDDFDRKVCQNMNGNKTDETDGVYDENRYENRRYLYNKGAKRSKSDESHNIGGRESKVNEIDESIYDFNTRKDKTDKISQSNRFKECYNPDSSYRSTKHTIPSPGHRSDYETHHIQDEIQRKDTRDYFYPRYRSDERRDRNANDCTKIRENNVKSYGNHDEEHFNGNVNENSRERSPDKMYKNREKIHEIRAQSQAEEVHQKIHDHERRVDSPGRYHGPPCPARRPLPPRPRSEPVNMALPSKTTVPLKVWVVASASCFGVCAALVLATVIITKWGTGEDYSRREVFQQVPEPIYAPYPNAQLSKTSTEPEVPLSESAETVNEIEYPILEKLGIFKNIVANREPKQNDKKHLTLASKHQFHPIHENMHHVERKIEKKDQAKYPQQITNAEIDHHRQQTDNIASDVQNNLERKLNVRYKSKVPEFKPKLPDVFLNKDIHSILSKIRSPDIDYEEYYNDENLYSDYMESNTMTSYLIEKVQELHDWIIKDPDFEVSANISKADSGKMSNDFGQLLKALNESLIEGNVTIVMNKLRDIYFGANYTHTNQTRKVILSNSTDLLSFGILTLDIMLLHNIQLMAWENQEQSRAKMLKDADVFAFNALFLEPAKVEAKRNEINNHISHHDNNFFKRQSGRPELEELEPGRNLLEDVLDMGMSTARAAIHLGRAYKNTKIVLNQLSNSNKDALNANIQSQMSRNVDGNTHALQHLQTSFDSAANATGYTELDCVWLLYCRNLAATSKLNAPYGTMARINGIALRMLTGELAVDRALDTMIYEALAGWTDLRCTDMFPRCGHVDAASVVLESILAPMRKNTGSSATSASKSPTSASKSPTSARKSANSANNAVTVDG